MTLEEQAFDQEIEDAGLPGASRWSHGWRSGVVSWWRIWVEMDAVFRHIQIPNEKTSKHWDSCQQLWVWVKGILCPAKIRRWSTTFSQHPNILTTWHPRGQVEWSKWNHFGRILIPTFWYFLVDFWSSAASLSRQGGDCRQKSFAEARSIESIESIEPKNRWAHLSTDLE